MRTRPTALYFSPADRPVPDLIARWLGGKPFSVTTFGDSEELYRDLMALGFSHWNEATDIQFPEHMVFIDRALAGHFGNLNRLRAAGPWRELVMRYTARP